MRLALRWSDVDEVVAGSTTCLSDRMLIDWILAGEPGGVMPLAAGTGGTAGQSVLTPRPAAC